MIFRSLLLILLLAAGCGHDVVKDATVIARFTPKSDAHLVFAIKDGQKVTNLKAGYFEPRSTGTECYALRPNGGLSRCGDEHVSR
jgi:hypothetical protein